MRLKDKIAIVTGAGMGIGRAIAILFGREGAKVVVNDEHKSEAEEVAGQINKEKGEALAFCGDVTKPADVDIMVKNTLDKFGRIDILVNNVGMVRAFDFLDSREEDREFPINSTLRSTILCTHRVLPAMIKQAKGKIINITSLLTGSWMPNLEVHTAAKTAVDGFTRAMATTYAEKGININAVAPGITAGTPHIDLLLDDPIVKEKILAHTPARRPIKPEDVAQAAVFLASDESDNVVGQILRVDGGFTLL